MRRSFFLAAAALAMVGLTTPAFAQNRNNDRERAQDIQKEALEREFRIRADIAKADLDRTVARREAEIALRDSDFDRQVDQLRLRDRDARARDLASRANDIQRDSKQRLDRFKRDASRQINDRLQDQLEFLQTADRSNRSLGGSRSFGRLSDFNGRGRFVDFDFDDRDGKRGDRRFSNRGRDFDFGDFRFSSRSRRGDDRDFRFSNRSRDNDRDFRFSNRRSRGDDRDFRFSNRRSRDNDRDFRFSNRRSRDNDRDFRFSSRSRRGDDRDSFFRSIDGRRRSLRASDEIFGFGPRVDVTFDRDDSRIFRGFDVDREFRARDGRRSFDLSDLFDRDGRRDNRRGRDFRNSRNDRDDFSFFARRRNRDQLSNREIARQIRDLGDDLNDQIRGRRGDQIEARLDRLADQIAGGRNRDVRSLNRRDRDFDFGRSNRNFPGSRNDFFFGRRVGRSL